ncbi:endonuclease/exonuclease/phosphatase family protein [Arthrobacter halodurans]|uniref:Endonuclease/exonuclease/phosphatase family protein n=1 Tax=Arthrobacter halodurans TaxID=516699 RepID=A0ABV4UIS6_9MICC
MFRRLLATGSVAALVAAGAVLGSASALAAPGNPGAKTTEVRVMSFNIHHGADGEDDLNLERTARVIEQSGAEIIGLQEVDNHWSSRSDFVDQAAWLADRLDMHFAYGANLDEAPLDGAADNRQYGNAVLSEYPIISSENHLLESIDYPVMPTEQRGLLEAVVNVRGNHISFYSTHLDHQRAEQRELQAREIAGITQESRRPAVVVGDLNAEPDEASLQPLFSVLTDTFAALGQDQDYTFAPDLEGAPGSGSVENPSLRIDYILASRGIAVKSAAVIKTSASDHLPIVADLSIRKSPNGLLK